MGTRDPRVDAYIVSRAEFARPILTHLREIVHAASPECNETIKWGMPHFDYKGSMMCHMAAFKAHCAFGFWKGPLVLGNDSGTDSAMGQFGRITSLKDLPSKRDLTQYIKTAMRLNDEGVKAPAQRKLRPEPSEHPELTAALARNAAARRHFDQFTPGKRRDYNEWIADAKSDATRARRIEQAVEWIAEGKPRNWKYMR